jgi:hypothetical protein
VDELQRSVLGTRSELGQHGYPGERLRRLVHRRREHVHGVPADGTYSFGVFKEATITGNEYTIACGGDLNRNDVCNESFAAIWNTSSDTVWVDSDANKSFAGEKAMKNYDVNYGIGIFGTDNPRPRPVRPSRSRSRRTARTSSSTSASSAPSTGRTWPASRPAGTSSEAR